MKSKEFKVGDRVSFWHATYEKKLKGKIIKIISKDKVEILTKEFRYTFTQHSNNLKKLVKKKKVVLELKGHLRSVTQGFLKPTEIVFITTDSLSELADSKNLQVKLIFYKK